MSISLALGILVLVCALFWIIRSSRKEASHLDDLHINTRDR